MRGYREIAPRRELSPYVSALWVWEDDGRLAGHRVLPDGCLDILFSIRSRGAALDAVGTMTRALEVPRAGVPLLLGARFRPGAAAPFLSSPAHELTDRRIDLEDLWGSEARRWKERLAEPGRLEARLQALEETLLERLRAASRSADRSTTVRRAAAWMEHAGGRVAVRELARELGMSPQHLRRRFLETVGLSPKRLARVLRFQSLVGRALAAVEASGRRPPWAGLAVDAGYYDQAHMIGEFRRLAGLSPDEYLRRRGYGSPERAGREAQGV